MSEILQVRQGASRIDDIIGVQHHTYTPYSKSYQNNEEIRIAIQPQDLYVQPSESFLVVEFKPIKRDGTPIVKNDGYFTQLGAVHFFNEMRYELNGLEIDRSKIPATTCTLKTRLACKTVDKFDFEMIQMLNGEEVSDKTYRVIIPLKFIFGFCDDYNKVLINCKHELILVRSRTDLNVYYGSKTDSMRFEIYKIAWKVPHVTLSDKAKLDMLRIVERREDIPLSFRSWDLYELPQLMETTHNIWSVKTTTQATKPRYVAVALQTNRNHVPGASPSHMDHCNISNMRLFLNNERFPYDDMNLDFSVGNCYELNNVLCRIQNGYYNGTQPINPNPTIPDNFKLLNTFAFDCSRSDESIKNGMVDVRIEMEARRNFPANTTVYCLIIHDNLIRYNPATGNVDRFI